MAAADESRPKGEREALADLRNRRWPWSEPDLESTISSGNEVSSVPKNFPGDPKETEVIMQAEGAGAAIAAVVDLPGPLMPVNVEREPEPDELES